jgi:hypothetical protein
MDIVNMIEAVGYSGDDEAAGNQAQGIQFKGTVLYRDVPAVEVGRNLCRLLGFGARLLGAYLIQQPTENQSYKQPFGQTKTVFLTMRKRDIYCALSDPVQPTDSLYPMHLSSSSNYHFRPGAIFPLAGPSTVPRRYRPDRSCTEPRKHRDLTDR